MRIAIVHDKLMQFGGGERVALTLQRNWPDSDLFTSVYDPELAASVGFREPHATVLQRVPALGTAHHYFLPLYDGAFRRLRFDDYDAVVSTPAMFAKSVRVPPGVPHICYCLTPIRMLWGSRDGVDEDIARFGVARRLAVRTMIPWLQRADRRAADEVDAFVAISTHIAGEIQRCYGRTSELIHPPVDTDRYDVEVPRGDYVLAVARLYPYKRVDLVIEACGRLGLPLKIVGEGPDRPRLEAMAGPGVEFLGWIDEAAKPEIFAAATAMVAPQVEDFGIAMVEAIAAGTPVIALHQGGALDIVDAGVTGEFFDRQDADAVTDALARHDPAGYDRVAMRASAARFTTDRFMAEMTDIVERTVREHRGAPSTLTA